MWANVIDVLAVKGWHKVGQFSPLLHEHAYNSYSHLLGGSFLAGKGSWVPSEFI